METTNLPLQIDQMEEKNMDWFLKWLLEMAFAMFFDVTNDREYLDTNLRQILDQMYAVPEYR